MPKFRKKPVVIEARQFKELKDIPNLLSWINGIGDRAAEHKNYKLIIHTLEGDHEARIGDWIIKGVHNEFYPCNPIIFKKTYDLVGETDK